MNREELLSLESVLEHDVDLMLLEEFYVSPDFVQWFAQKLGLPVESISNVKAQHSVSDEDGESDLVVTYCSDESQYAMLIENKVDASAQKDQAKRYLKRASKLPCKAVGVVLIAPQDYLDRDTQQYPNKISYESIAIFFEERKTSRDIYRADFLRNAIAGARRGYCPKMDPVVTSFWKAYYDELKKYIPDAEMTQPVEKPSDSDWPTIKFPKLLPEKWTVVHKMSQGHMDLETTWNEEEKNQFQGLLGNIKNIALMKVGKKYNLRLSIPELDRKENFEAQLSDLHKCFDALLALKQLMK